MADVTGLDKQLAATTAAPGFGGRRLPDEVELYVDPRGAKFVVESFVDPGSCRDHWVGIARRTPLAADGKPLVDRASFWVAGTTAAYEHALDAWVRGDSLGALKLLGPSLRWSTPMYGTVRARLAQVNRGSQPVIDKLPGFALAPGEQLTLRDEPHPEGRSVGAIGPRPATGGPAIDYRVIAPVRASDGYPRVGPGQWLYVLAPSSGALGFTQRPQKK